MDKINIGVDVGGTTINVGAVTADGRIIDKITAHTQSGRGDSEMIIESIIYNIKALLKKLDLSNNDIASIGLGFPGTVESQKGIVVFAPNIFFRNVDVKSKIAYTFNCPIYLGQDSRAAAWGEYCVGAGKNYNNIAAITIGTGIGCGLIINGMIFHGGYNTAGEFGHQLLDPNGPQCNCGRKGCLETYCAGLAITQAGKALGDNLKVKDIYQLAESGNKAALKITEQVVHSLGIGMVNLINLISLEMIAISGGISNAPDHLLLNPLREFVQKHAYSAVAQKIEIVHSSLGDNAPLIGAALLDETTEY
ncbi:ROK family protein [Parabacteroides sp. OttesenSCG-928-G07]|nr:ROK family protein [Parabacteroides sp. OttesenSCG-928-G21]MDL2278432.1 ROK family protein [Parabacteroides sp. OttesenSCG-928-G07]